MGKRKKRRELQIALDDRWAGHAWCYTIVVAACLAAGWFGHSWIYDDDYDNGYTLGYKDGANVVTSNAAADQERMYQRMTIAQELLRRCEARATKPSFTLWTGDER